MHLPPGYEASGASGPPLFMALQQQLGFKLAGRQGPGSRDERWLVPPRIRCPAPDTGRRLSIEFDRRMKRWWSWVSGITGTGNRLTRYRHRHRP
ncbi:hypothetical protein SBA4_4380003 [Candidatus Sulfopaludibacter sp. SbA4]|nr:hypothetical protein SBA4_4380003 [Candidatus Sulfopaludibacter sp. SbA4]